MVAESHRFSLDYYVGMCGAEAAYKIRGNLRRDQWRRHVGLHLQGYPLKCFSAPLGLEVLLDIEACDFLIISWEPDDRRRSYSKTMADSFYGTMLEQQRHL